MSNAEIIEEAKKLNERYNFFITLKHPQEGIPVAVKDNICTKGIPTSAGSRIIEQYIPPFDATVVERLKANGYSILGKTAMDEFGFGTFSANTFCIPKNPHDPKRSCGGSSGGSAGYVAASRFARFALAQSTGGSISAPAAFCGVVGLTPTYGRVSRYGLIDYANSLDKIGVVAKTVRDASKALEIISGPDNKDETCQGARFSDPPRLSKKITIGIPKEWLAQKIDAGVKKCFDDAVKKLESLGMVVKEVSIPTTPYALAAYYIIALAEASTNLAKYCGLRYGSTLPLEEGGEYWEYFSKVRGKYFGTEAKRRILLGTFVRMAGYRDKYYVQAQKVRQLLINDFKNAFKMVDIIASPTMPIIAPTFEEIKKLSPLEEYSMDVLTVPANLAGLPHLSIPCGTAKGMPVGLHLIADHNNDELLVQVGENYG
ncbi:MAG: amidase family protein [Candidatus Woesearchaeota archaeon]